MLVHIGKPQYFCAIFRLQSLAIGHIRAEKQALVPVSET